MMPNLLPSLLLATCSIAAPITGGLTFLTFQEGTYDVELGVFDLASGAPQSLYNFSTAEFESGYWVESSFIAGDSNSTHATWVSNLQYDDNQTQGALLEIELTDLALRWVNATYCWSMFLDARDPSGSTVLCVADNAMDLSRSRGRRASRGTPLRSQPSGNRGPPRNLALTMPTDTRDVLVYSIERLSGTETLVGEFAVGLEEDIAVTYDSKRNIIWAMLQNDVTNANYLVGFDVAAGTPVPNAAPVAYDKLIYAMQYDLVLDSIVAVVSTWDATKQAWNTGFGSIEPHTATFTPIGPVNGTFAAFRQFNDIDCIAPSISVFFLTCFDWVLPDTTLYVVGVSTVTGEIVYKEPVRNPFIDISYVETWGGGEPQLSSHQLLSGLAADSFSTQLSFYNFASGMFGDEAVNDPFWTTANALANAATLQSLTGDQRPAPVIANSFAVLVPHYSTPTRGNDDIQWHAHAWLRAYEASGSVNATYLDEVVHIYNLLFDPTSPWHGWNSTCGAMNWWSNNPYVNVITNGLAFTGLVNLQRVVGPDVQIQGKTTLAWALLIWKWAQTPGLLTKDGVFMDGLGSDCVTVIGSPWTYNSGIWLDGLTGLSLVQNDTSYSDFAFTLAQSATSFFANGDADGVMREVSCSQPDGDCSGADGREFKGVFIRHLAYALKDWTTAGTAASNAPAAAWARAWIAKQAASLLANDASALPPANTPLFGQLWQGPFEADNTPWISHSAGNDVVLAELMALQMK